MKYLKIGVIERVEITYEQAVRLEAAISLATCPDFNHSDLREDVLKQICKKDKDVAALIETFRRENQ